MIHWMQRIQLRTGFIISIILPSVFTFAQPIDDLVHERFIYGFMALIGMWTIVFSLVDFRPWLQNDPRVRWYHLAGTVLLALAAITIVYFVIGMMDSSGLLLYQLRGDRFYSFHAWLFFVLRIWIFGAFFIVIRYLFDTMTEKQRKENELAVLRTEGLLALNESLKQQISPHFLFNSLTTLKALVKQKNDLSITFIDELSSVYRYMLSHYGKDQVAIKEEVEFLSSYLSLLRIRFGDALCTEITIPERICEKGIPPNTLQILIENAVKHNVLTTKRPLNIRVYVQGEYLVVWNNFQPKAPEGPSSHVGLANINNRYMILKGRAIIVENDELSFSVRLPLD